MNRWRAARRPLLAALTALAVTGLLTAAAPAAGAGLAGPAGGTAASPASATSAGQAAERPSSVCQPNGAGCTKAGTYLIGNGLINADFNGFKVAWTSAVVQPYSSGVPLWWAADITYTNVSGGTLDLSCPGSWPDASFVQERMSGGSGDDGVVPASSTACSQDPGLSQPVPPGGRFTSTAAFHNVPWPGSGVSVAWGDAGSSPVVKPFTAPPAPACSPRVAGQCQSLNPLVTQDILYFGDVSTCVFDWNVDWGDGNVSDGLIVPAPPDGLVALVSHRYTTSGTFTISVTGSVLSGNCTATGGQSRFTLLGYVALGDSYSSGVGAGNYLPGNSPPTGGCTRSYNAYSRLLAAKLGDNPKATSMFAAYTTVACSGATSADFEQSQGAGLLPQFDDIDFFNGTVGLVTFTIGGNDIGFADVVQDCAFNQRTTKHTCQSDMSAKTQSKLATLPASLSKVFSDLSALTGLAKNARVMVIGYPLPFDPQLLAEKNTPTCWTGFLTFTFVKSDMAWIDRVVQRLDGILKTAALAAGFKYVDESHAFNGGHYLCEKGAAIHPAEFPDVVISFHPTNVGQQLMAGVLEKAMGIG
jgi:hypothetical protein